MPSESFHRSSWDSRTCYPSRATNHETLQMTAPKRRKQERRRKQTSGNSSFGKKFLMTKHCSTIPVRQLDDRNDSYERRRHQKTEKQWTNGTWAFISRHLEPALGKEREEEKVHEEDSKGKESYSWSNRWQKIPGMKRIWKVWDSSWHNIKS